MSFLYKSIEKSKMSNMTTIMFHVKRYTCNLL